MELLEWDRKVGTMNWSICSACSKYHLEGCELRLYEKKNSNGYLSSLTNNSQQSEHTTMLQASTPTFVYQRKRQNRKYSGIKHSDGSHSAVTTETPSVTECATEVARSPVTNPVQCNTETPICLRHEKSGSEEALINDVDRIDNCSSSRSNLELSSASLRMDMDDAGECSCSDEFTDKVPKGISERDIPISILKDQGVLLDKVYTRRVRVASRSSTAISSPNHCLKLCKVCERLDCTSKLLICDNCEDSFHVSCCNLKLSTIPVDEWLCSSCAKKKNDGLGSLGFMFRETEPYMSKIRIGNEFQASIPDFCVRVDNEYDLVSQPLEVQPCNNVSIKEKSSTEPLELSPIGNWLQCQEVINSCEQGVDETICGKWRRAPLFEVQTDIWECHCCILWDPAHADCSVPQELETAEVMNQLKYVEMLRSRLPSKRRKLHCLKNAEKYSQ